MPACDFLHVDCAITMKRVYVFFVIEVGSRWVYVLGTTSNPDGAWTVRAARDLLMALGQHAASFDLAEQRQMRAKTILGGLIHEYERAA